MIPNLEEVAPVCEVNEWTLFQDWDLRASGRKVKRVERLGDRRYICSRDSITAIVEAVASKKTIAFPQLRPVDALKEIVDVGDPANFVQDVHVEIEGCIKAMGVFGSVEVVSMFNNF